MKKFGILLLILSNFWRCIGNPMLDTSKKFDSKIWKKVDADSGVRHGMIDDLLKNILKKGMSRKATITILGKPDDTACGGLQAKNKNVDSYRISKGLEVCSLDISYNNSGVIDSLIICCN